MDEAKVLKAIRSLCNEKIYEEGDRDKGISTRFIMRLSILQKVAGLPHHEAAAAEAEAFFEQEKKQPHFRIEGKGTPYVRVFVQCSDCMVDIREMQPHEHINVRRAYYCDDCDPGAVVLNQGDLGLE